MAKSVDDAAEPGLAWENGGVGVVEGCAGPQGDAFQAAERHRQGPAIAEPNDFARHIGRIGIGDFDPAAQANGPLRPADLHQKPLNPRYAPKSRVAGKPLDSLKQTFHVSPCLAVPPLTFFPGGRRFPTMHLEPEALSGGKLNEANQGDVWGCLEAGGNPV